MWPWRIFLTLHSTLNLFELASFLHHSTKLLFPNSPMNTELFISYSTHFMTSPGLSHFSKCHQHLRNRSSPNSRSHPFFFSDSHLLSIRKPFFAQILKHPNIPTSLHFHCTSFQLQSPFIGYPAVAFHFISASTLICLRTWPNASPLESVPLRLFGKDLSILKPSPESTAWPSWTSADLIELYLFCSPTPPMHPLLLR